MKPETKGRLANDLYILYQLTNFRSILICELQSSIPWHYQNEPNLYFLAIKTQTFMLF